MAKIYVIDKDNRLYESRSDLNVKNDQRSTNVRSITRESLEAMIDNLKWEYQSIRSYLKEKEEIKLRIFSLSIVMLGVLIGFSVALFKYNYTEEYPYILYPILLTYCVINYSILKYIITVKIDTLRLMQKSNCVRQSLDEALFASLDGYFPDKESSEMKSHSIYANVYKVGNRKTDENNDFRSEYGSFKSSYLLNPETLIPIFSIFSSLFIFAFAGYNINHVEGSNIEFMVFSIGLVFFVIGATSSLLYSMKEKFIRIFNEEEGSRKNKYDSFNANKISFSRKLTSYLANKDAW